MRLMRIVLLAAGTAATLPAAAADLGSGSTWNSNAGSAPAVWQGLYAGAHVGAGFGKAGRQRTSGAMAGLAIGYNWQADRIVAGVEADITSSDLAGKSSDEVYRQGRLMTVRGRAGYTFGNLLAYATGGPAFVGTAYRSSGGKKDASIIGWAAGLGAEIYMTRTVSLKGEFLHYGINEENYPTSSGSKKFDPTSNAIRAGFNYRF
jgi:outer membrane immunogenic protein